MTNLSGANLNNGVAVGPQGEGMDSPSTFPTYPAYKDSGVEWLREVPEHWEVGSFRRLIKSVGNGTTADQVDEATDTVAVSRIETISTGQINFEKAGHVGPQDVAKRFLMNAGDILFSHINSLSMVGNVAIYLGGRPLLHGMNLLRIQPLSSVSSEWVLYWLKSKNIRQEVESRAKPAINQASISTDSVRALPALIPPKVEQTQIARFLDHETARIDALIEEQQRLIELLKEKRQAVISHAVTKGLDPTVPMKDSGVEWLGEVPAHWEVVRVKHIKSGRPNAFVDGPFGSNLKSEHFVDDGGVYVIESGFATTGELSFSDLKQITPIHFETIRRSEVRTGDIVIAKIGARYGMCSILPQLDKPAVVSGNSLKLTVNELICDSRFAVFVLQHLKERGAIEDIVNMTAQPALSLGEMNNLPFPLPSLDEQLSIVSELDTQLGEFEALTSECKQVMSLSIERRSALISAAVTGKIDVRGWQPPASVQAPVLEAEAV